jgi:hypothetical protein
MPTTDTKPSIAEQIDKSVARFIEIRDIIQREPAFARWELLGGGIDFRLVQFWPTHYNDATAYPIAERQRDAKAIARALGGTWKRDPHSGSWDGQVPLHSGITFTVHLHRVDRVVDGLADNRTHIDLNAPDHAEAPQTAQA